MNLLMQMVLIKNLGYLFVVDLHIPECVHGYFNDYPMAPEPLIIDDFIHPLL